MYVSTLISLIQCHGLLLYDVNTWFQIYAIINRKANIDARTFTNFTCSDKLTKLVFV